MNQKTYKLAVPIENGTNFVIDVSTPHYSTYLDRAMDRLNHVQQLHETLHTLVREMAPVALISRSEAYQQAGRTSEMSDPLGRLREPFETMHREYFPGINVTRKGELYTNQQVNNHWFIWLLAKGIPLPVDMVNPSQYYYKVNGCKATNPDRPDCICWHDRGTGPFPEGKEGLKWRSVVKEKAPS